MLSLNNRKHKRLSKFISFLLIIILPLSAFFLLFVPVHAQDEPIHVHLTWQHDPNTTITVAWQTTLASAGDLVYYDIISRGGVPSNYLYNATGINFTYSGATGFIHEVELTGLIPGTTYYFICGGPTGGYSEERSFRTAPSVSSDVRFIAGGDSRTNVAEREAISKAMAKFNPDFVMHSGDMVNDGTTQSLWDTWFNDLHDNWIGDDNRTIPLIPTVGNHEYPENPNTKYFNQLALPGNEKWFSVDWGPDIHIIVLNTENSTSGGQKTWLESDLANHSNYKWKFAVLHQPPFAATRTSGHAGALADFVPLFDKYHVDIVFAGHDHAYMRTKPINYTESTSQSQPYENGTLYVVTGGWGAPLYDILPFWYDAYSAKIYHFCVVDVFKNGSLRLQAKDNQGITFDEAWIIKNESLPLSVSINLTTPAYHKALPIDLTWNASGIIDHYEVYIDGQFQEYLASLEKSYQIISLAEGNHTIDISAVDPLGNVINATTELSYDLTPPSTSDDYDNFWHGSDFTITLTASDASSGVAETYYMINSGPANNVSANGQPLITSESANNNLEYWSVDRATNEETPRNSLLGIKLDKTPPMANADSNQTLGAGTNCTFNGSASTDNIVVANYTWTFVDGTPQTYTEAVFNHAFNTMGLYQVTLNVSDYAGWWDIDIIWINVTESTPPTTTDNYDGLWHAADFAITLDANDTISGVAETYYRINEGVTYNISANGQPFITTESANNTLEYWSIDNLANEELPHNMLLEIKLDKTPPIANAGSNQTLGAGTNCTFNGSASTDNIAVANYTWNFIDGTPQTYTGVAFDHTFNAIGLYQVTLNVSDSAGWWDTDSIWINVTDSSPPVANLTPIKTIIVGNAVTFNATASTDNVGIIIYEWNFGDGNVTITTTPIITHVYLVPGTYIVNLTVRDAANNSDSTAITITVERLNGGFPGWVIGLLAVVTVIDLIYLKSKRKIKGVKTKEMKF